MAGRRGMLKRKPNFTLQEIDVLLSEVLKYEQLLFGAASTNVNAHEKQKIWWRITSKISAAGRNQRDIGEVKNRWRGLRRRANDKIARHRLQQRRAPPLAERLHLTRLPGPGGSSKPSARPEFSPDWSLVHGACPSDPPPLPGALEAAAAAQDYSYSILFHGTGSPQERKCAHSHHQQGLFTISAVLKIYTIQQE